MKYKRLNSVLSLLLHKFYTQTLYLWVGLKLFSLVKPGKRQDHKRLQTHKVLKHKTISCLIWDQQCHPCHVFCLLSDDYISWVEGWSRRLPAWGRLNRARTKEFLHPFQRCRCGHSNKPESGANRGIWALAGDKRADCWPTGVPGHAGYPKSF